MNFEMRTRSQEMSAKKKDWEREREKEEEFSGELNEQTKRDHKTNGHYSVYNFCFIC